jgi:hypothetical protein
MKINSHTGLNTPSLSNRLSDINLEFMKINKKLSSLEAINEKIDSGIKEEAKLRQNVEKKTFHMSETFSEKFLALRKGFDDLASAVTDQIEQFKVKFIDEGIHKNNERYFKGFEEALRRIETVEKNSNNFTIDFNLLKSESNSKYVRLEDTIINEIKEVKKEIINNNTKVEILDKKLNENLNIVKEDISKLSKEINSIKNDVEMIKSFRENSNLNFKDISKEFIKSEETLNKFSNKISMMVQEIEGKMKHFESTFTLQNDNFVNIKKDIYAQIYDMNLNANNKFQKINEQLFEKLENNQKVWNNFKDAVIMENDKFTVYMTDQMEQNYKNMKKLIEYSNEDLDLLKSKCTSIEDIIKNMRTEFFHNLNEVEEFLIKKYEALFRSISVDRNENF